MTKEELTCTVAIEAETKIIVVTVFQEADMTELYHYVDSGLDNVYLRSGYTFHETPYGRGISIQDTEGLHRAIGESIVNNPSRLNGAELRFIRLEMELTQKCLADLIETTEQNIGRWEKDRKKNIQGPVDRMLRALYLEYIGGDGSVRRMVDRLAQLDHTEKGKLCLSETDKGWKPDYSCL